MIKISMKLIIIIIIEVIRIIITSIIIIKVKGIKKKKIDWRDNQEDNIIRFNKENNNSPEKNNIQINENNLSSNKKEFLDFEDFFNNFFLSDDEILKIEQTFSNINEPKTNIKCLKNYSTYPFNQKFTWKPKIKKLK